jgi:hypothetical protein
VRVCRLLGGETVRAMTVKVFECGSVGEVAIEREREHEMREGKCKVLSIIVGSAIAKDRARKLLYKRHATNKERNAAPQGFARRS